MKYEWNSWLTEYYYKLKFYQINKMYANLSLNKNLYRKTFYYLVYQSLDNIKID